jgi:Putative zinc-finger
MLKRLDTKGLDHLSDEDILLFSEGEISGTREDEMRRHLATCADCQMRGDKIAGTLSELSQLKNVSFGAMILSPTAARARLKARLSEMTSAEVKPWWRRFVRETSIQRWAYVSTAFGVVVLCLAGLSRPGSLFHRQAVSAYLEARPVPNSDLTPGVTRPVGLADICPRRESDLDPAVPPSVRRVVFKEYGIADVPSKDYQVDYLINPQLGGTDDIRNLWPQPYGTTVWNARAKDALEDRLYQMVCSKQIDLASAQRDIARDWISAYKKYFHTSNPA